LAKKDTKVDKDGVFKVTLVLDKENIDEGRLNYGKQAVPGQDWIKAVRQMCKDAGATTDIGGEGCPIKDGDKTGKEEFAGKYLIPVKSAYKPALIDTKGNALPAQIPVYSGDLIKVALQPVANTVKGKTYMSLYLSKVMLIEKLTGGAGDVSMFGEEDGYQVSEADAAGAEDTDFGSDFDSTDDARDF
jgi:hypothetical protein